MSLPSLNRRHVLFGLGAALGTFALPGCTLTPVYSDRGAAAQRLNLRYAAPNSRLEQVFYQTLSARAGATRNHDAPELSVSIAISESRIGLTTVSTPLTEYQIVAAANYQVRRGDEVLVSGRRTATGGYQRSGQLVANDAAKSDAEERVVRALAETVRLALVAELSAP
ncbi:hypothetical protein [Pelagibacterium lentulum]|uniref:LPS-assembly lipoprotein n=1 Tax=Pelagibacterium lentulum TaxID=2029865 RepID=A0A916VUU3_9HYPH|nr:hypothetical protein [Pelagibacterium lentulum]GGA37296.1 hypothetical protein GCM10011499_03320 [Pelagibacterium lentulum]